MCAAGARVFAVERFGQPHPVFDYRLPRWHRRAANDNHAATRTVRNAALVVGAVTLVCTSLLLMVLS